MSDNSLKRNEEPIHVILDFALREWSSEAQNILEHLKNEGPFKLLVRTILSQNTSDRNSRNAFLRLDRNIGATPESIANARLDELMKALRVAGLYRERSIRLKEIAKIIIEDYGKDLKWIRSLPLNEARKRLLALPGVGYKTADIMLAFYGEKPILPVDTHIRRLALRLGYASPKDNYDKVREVLESKIEPSKRAIAHLLLIRFGREICKARKPLCRQCPVSNLCSYSRK